MVSEVSVCAVPRSSLQYYVLPSVCHLQELSYCLLTCTYGLSFADSLVQLQSKLRKSLEHFTSFLAVNVGRLPFASSLLFFIPNFHPSQLLQRLHQLLFCISLLAGKRGVCALAKLSVYGHRCQS